VLFVVILWTVCLICFRILPFSVSQWPRDLRHGSATDGLMGLRVRIPPGTWLTVCCECFVLSNTSLGVGLITRPEESYRLWCV
jgi:hypothetical protein